MAWSLIRSDEVRFYHEEPKRCVYPLSSQLAYLLEHHHHQSTMLEGLGVTTFAFRFVFLISIECFGTARERRSKRCHQSFTWTRHRDCQLAPGLESPTERHNQIAEKARSFWKIPIFGDVHRTCPQGARLQWQ
jgi:hypothetical protein